VPNSSIAQDADEMMLLLSNFVPSNPDASVKREIIVDAGALAGLRKRRQIEDMVIDAMENDRIEIHYQPIYDISTGLFSSAEALVRIRLKDGTLMYPDNFIPIVEESGRIIPLSDNIYKKVLSFIKLYRIEKLGVNRVALNLSVKQGERAVFVSRFLELLEKHSINPNLINLEITETSSLSSKENLLTNMKKLTEHGITFSLDDFGSGSSNLNYIIDMPISTVKLDRYLTDEYFKNSRAKAIVKTIIEMSHSLGIKIIAEGIETEVGLNEMKQLGVDFIQGYYFSKPVPEHEYLKFIQINNLK
jgi:EAL domain-containing protein (putative c-di-GMP-specific phosphodiesterase class I)